MSSKYYTDLLVPICRASAEYASPGADCPVLYSISDCRCWLVIVELNGIPFANQLCVLVHGLPDARAFPVLAVSIYRVI
jgi:hypothetical protein